MLDIYIKDQTTAHIFPPGLALCLQLFKTLCLALM